MNPFQPGAGLLPSHMGHRPEIEDRLLDIVDRLAAGQTGPRLAYLYGPRGNGKTVLLQWLENQASRKVDGLPIVRIHMIPEHLESSESLYRRLVDSVRRAPEIFRKLAVDVEADLLGMFKVKLGRADAGDPLPGLSAWLERDDYPVLLTLDEAHEANPAVLGRFLNAVQLAGRSRPVAAVLAGTPGLQETLSASRSSFWSRGARLAVGLLSDDEARTVLARPFQDANLDVDRGAVATLARMADDYPYFLQLYGEAAWNAMRESDARGILPEHAETAIRTTSTPRREYYRERFEEFRRENILPLARDVALAFREADGRMTEAKLSGLLARHAGDPSEILSSMNAKGFVWRDGSDYWTPGVPSLMDYMIEQTQP